jgi:hypothetical protein
LLEEWVIDLMDKRADVAIRVGSMRPLQLMPASSDRAEWPRFPPPTYLARRVPQTPYDLDAYNCIAFNFARHVDERSFVVTGPTCLCRLAAMLL